MADLADGALRSFVFGLTIAAAVGPIALLIVNYGINRGFRAGLAAGCGAAIADLLYAIVAFLAGAQILPWLADHETLFRRISSAVLLLLGLWMLWAALRHTVRAAAAKGPAAGTRAGSPFMTTFLLTIVNPLTVLLFAGFAGQLPLGGSVRAAVLLALAVCLGSLIVQTAFAAGGAALAQVLGDIRWQRLMNGLSGLVVAAFGLRGLWT